MESEIDREFDRIEKEIKGCKCSNSTEFEKFVLGDCHLCDVRYAKYEGMRFSVHQRLKEEIKWLQSVLETKHIKEEDRWIIESRLSKLQEEIKEYNFGGLIE